MPNRSRSVFRAGAPKRQVEWSGVADQGFISIGAGASVIISSLSFAEKSTIVRNRGILSVKSSQSAADANLVGAMGVGIVSAEALAAGAASIPGPFSQAEWDGWMVWQPIAFAFEFLDATGVLINTREFMIDSKAMRKVGANEAAVTMFESQNAAMVVSVVLRTLVKLA